LFVIHIFVCHSAAHLSLSIPHRCLSSRSAANLSSPTSLLSFRIFVCHSIAQRICRHPHLVLSFRSASFFVIRIFVVIPQRSGGICIRLSSAPDTNRHFDRSRTRFIVLRSGETPVFEGAKQSNKYRGLSTPAANNAASGRDDTLRLSNACHFTSLLSFRSSSLFVIRSFVLSFRSAAEESAFASPPHPLQTVISTGAGHASPSCAAEKPLYFRVPGRGTKYRGLSTPAANNAASGREDTLRESKN
jgi:hypothetical protein